MPSLLLRIALGITLASGLIGLTALAALAGMLPAEIRLAFISVASTLAAVQPPVMSLGFLDFGAALNLALIGGTLLCAWIIRLFISR